MASFGVIFDADGVLFDSERQSLEALRLAIEITTNDAVRLTDDQVEFVSGRDDSAVVAALNEKHGLAVDAAEFRRCKLDCYRRVLARDPIAVAPGVLPLLSALQAAGVPYAVATSATRAKLDLSLDSLGLQGRFPIVTTADDVAVAKPDPALFLLTAERLGLEPPRVIVFEDTINGIEAARRAGMFCVGVVGTFPRDRLAGADRVVQHLDGLSVPLLEAWLDGRGAMNSRG